LQHLQAELPALERLLEGLAIADRLDATEFANARRYVLDAAQRAIPKLSRELMPLRVRILDQLIEEPAAEDELPFLLYQRANSRRAIAPLDPDTLRSVLRDLDAAIELAQAVEQADIVDQAMTLRGVVLVALRARADGASDRVSASGRASAPTAPGLGGQRPCQSRGTSGRTLEPRTSARRSRRSLHAARVGHRELE
jgi:hypothetical protein